MTWTRRLRRIAISLILPCVIGVIWWTVPSDNSTYIPSLKVVATAFRSDWIFAQFWTDLVPSIRNLGLGFGLAALLGVVGGLVLYLVPTLGILAEPIVHFLRSLPPPALIPIAIVVLGVGTPMKISIIAIGSMWPTLLNTWEGIRGVTPELHDMSSVYRLSLWQRIRFVLLPAASPQILAGLRTTLQISIILIVVSEMQASTGGIGYRVLYAQQTFAIPQTWAGTLLLGIIGALASVMFGVVERRILSWQLESQQEASK